MNLYPPLTYDFSIDFWSLSLMSSSSSMIQWNSSLFKAMNSKKLSLCLYTSDWMFKVFASIRENLKSSSKIEALPPFLTTTAGRKGDIGPIWAYLPIIACLMFLKWTSLGIGLKLVWLWRFLWLMVSSWNRIAFLERFKGIVKSFESPPFAKRWTGFSQWTIELHNGTFTVLGSVYYGFAFIFRGSGALCFEYDPISSSLSLSSQSHFFKISSLPLLLSFNLIIFYQSS